MTITSNIAQTVAQIGTDIKALRAADAALPSGIVATSVQTFTPSEKLQGCTNLGVGDPTTDFLGAYETARDAV